MPTLARVFVKTGLLCLMLGLGSGLLLALQEGAGLPAAIHSLRPVFFHLFMVGWVTNLIFGVAWWMFPPASRESHRGKEGPFWFAYAALNLGLLLRAVAEPASAVEAGTAWGALLAVSGVLQFLGGAVFAISLWPRVRGKAS